MLRAGSHRRTRRTRSVFLSGEFSSAAAPGRESYESKRRAQGKTKFLLFIEFLRTPKSGIEDIPRFRPSFPCKRNPVLVFVSLYSLFPQIPPVRVLLPRSTPASKPGSISLSASRVLSLIPCSRVTHNRLGRERRIFSRNRQADRFCAPSQAF